MASPTTLFVAGMGTVIVALGLGFGGAMLLTSTQPVHKEPAAAFAKREQPMDRKAPETVAVAPAVAPVAEPSPRSDLAEPDLTVGLAPPLTASPIPKPNDVVKALSSNPPPAVVFAPSVTPPEEASAINRSEAPAPKKPKEVKGPNRIEKRLAKKPESRRSEDAEVEEDAADEPSLKETHAEPDRATRKGF